MEPPKFTPLAEVLEEAWPAQSFKNLNYMLRLHRYWPLIVGDALANSTMPASLKNKHLTVILQDMAYKNSLKAKQDDVLSQIASILQTEYAVRYIDYRLGDYRQFEQNQPVALSFDLPQPVIKKSLAVESAWQQEQYWHNKVATFSDDKLARRFLLWVKGLKQKNQH